MAERARSRSLKKDNDGFSGIVRCALVLAGVMAIGTLGFYLIEGTKPEAEQPWDLWQCFYFTLITITTVGYEDVGTSATGKMFTSVLLVLGIGTFTFALGELMRIAVGLQPAWKRKMTKQIEQLADHLVVCGFGQMGRWICSGLRANGIPFIVIEQDERAWHSAIDHGFLAIHGSSSDEDVLVRAGVVRARGVVCGVDSDAENIFTVLTVRDLNKNALIACRANSEGSVRRIERAGATLVVSPHVTAGADITTAILRPHLAELLSHSPRSGSGIEMSEVLIKNGSPLAGKSIANVGMQVDSIVFVAVQRPGQETMVRPGGNESFQPDDVVIVAGKLDDLSQMYQLAKPRDAA